MFPRHYSERNLSLCQLGRNGRGTGGLFVAAGIGFAAITTGQSQIGMRRVERVVTVKGLAETPVVSDVGSFSVPVLCARTNAQCRH